MSIFRKIGEVFEKIDYHISDDPEVKGKRFEDHVQSLFSPKYFKVIEKTHSHKTNVERYVESCKNPDFIFEYVPTHEQFAVECKYRTALNSKGMLEWSYPAQLERYRKFSQERKIPVYVVIGLEGVETEEDLYTGEEFDDYIVCMFNIPLEDAKYPALYESVFTKYERPYDKPFFWKNGILS